MCGIAGVLALKGHQPDKAVLAEMVGVLAHRGPDDSGYVVSGPCGLGNTRLAVIDLTEAAHQPMCISHEAVKRSDFQSAEAWIVYNGEVYNYREIRAALEATRHSFFSESDTETLLRAYIQYGVPNFIKAFRGMFALAIWDVEHQKLVLVRDRLGEKPLYYMQNAEWLVFGSEIKSLLKHPDVPVSLNQTAIPHYLAYGYPPSPETLFQGIKLLPPGHMLIADLSDPAVGARITIQAYWEPAYPSTEHDLRSEEDIASDLLAHLQWAVRMRMISDVPLGAFLSGGLDSAAIVALMSQESDRAVQTFSIGFANEPSFDETRYARQMVARFVTDHHEFIVDPNVIDLVEDLVWHHDQPFGDSSAIPTYLVSKMARQHVTVALTGDGSDELFAGYDRFRAAQLAHSFPLPGPATRAIEGFLETLPESTGYSDFVRRATRFIQAANLPLDERYLSWVRYVPAEWVEALINPESEQAVRQHYRTFFGQNKDEDADAILARLLDVNLRTYLPDDLLVKADRCSMAASLEARAPFLDHVLVQFAAGIPTSLKMKSGKSKYILKRALSGILPKAIIERKKHGFGVPVGSWLRADLSEYARSILLDPKTLARGIFNSEAVQQMLTEHTSGRSDLGHALWTLLTFELWMQRYFD